MNRCGKVSDFSQESGVSDPGVEVTNSYDEELSIGDRIAGRYEILSILGQGSMGVVYKCRHDILGRVVAIKTLRIQRNTDDRSQMRFEREARAASRLEHANLITVHDFGYTAQGVPYLVMDFVSGTPLYDILKRERYMVPERMVNLFAQVCDGLYHAHQRGVIHRDLKPANILVVPRENDTETVKIVDLGVAKIVHGAEEESEAITRTGEVCGSPIYLSPEQCMYQELDARTDIYSLGVCMYESLAGQPPLRGATVYDTIYMHVHDMPRPFPSEMKLPRKLEEIIFRCLAKSPADRYETMLQLKSELLASMRTGPETSAVNVLPPDALFGPKSNRSGEVPRPDASVRNSGSQQIHQQQPRAEAPSVEGEDARADHDMRRSGARKTGESSMKRSDPNIKRPTDSGIRRPTDSGIKRPADASRKSTDSGVKRPSVSAPEEYADDESTGDFIEARMPSREPSKSGVKKGSNLDALSNPKAAARKTARRDTADGDDRKERMRRMTLLGLSVASILIGLGLGLGFAVYIINEQKSDTKTASNSPSQSDEGLFGGAASTTSPMSSSSLLNKHDPNPTKKNPKKQGKNQKSSQPAASKPRNLEDVLAQSDAKYTRPQQRPMQHSMPQQDGSAGRFMALMQKTGGPSGGMQNRMPSGPNSLLGPGGMFNPGGNQGGMPGMGQAAPMTSSNTKLQQTLMKMNQDPRFQQMKQLIAASSQSQQAPQSPLGAFLGAQQQQPPQRDTSLGASPLADFKGDEPDATAAAMQASHEGFQFYADGNFEAACRKFEQASKLDNKPEYIRAYAQALNAYALTLNKQQKYAEAVHVEKKAVELAPDKKLYHDNLYRFSQNLENQRNGRFAPQ